MRARICGIKKPHSIALCGESEMRSNGVKPDKNESYALASLRRMAPAKPIKPVPSRVMLPGSGTGL